MHVQCTSALKNINSVKEIIDAKERTNNFLILRGVLQKNETNLDRVIYRDAGEIMYTIIYFPGKLKLINNN